jgi:hypothetical protein
MLTRLHHHVSYAGLDRWVDHVNWDSVALVATGVGTLVLAGGVILAVFGLWDAKKTRHGNLLTDLSRRWDDPLTMESLMLFSEHGPQGVTELAERTYKGASVDKGDLELFYDLNRWPNLIETIGVLWDEGVLDIRVIYKMWGPQILAGWLVWEEPVKKLRELDTYPITYRFFQRLAEALERELAKDGDAAAGQESGSQ